MCAKTYIPDAEHDTSLKSYDVTIPLCFGTVYYVENQENEPLNNLVRRCFQQDQNRLLPSDLQQIPYRFRYLTQSEVQTEKICGLLTEAGIDMDSRAATETLDLLHECLHSKTGGFLVARSLPEPPKRGKDDESLVPKDRLLSCLLPDTTDLDTHIGNFMLALAKADFESLAGVSYGRYYNDKYEWRGSRSSSGTMGFLISKLDIHEIDKTMKQTLTELIDSGQIKLLPEENINDTPAMLKKIAEAIEDNKEIDILCKLEVDDKGDIFFQPPQGGHPIKCRFESGLLGKALYILFLRQIERAAADPSGRTPSSICLTFLDEYKNELLAIYKEMGPSGSPFYWARMISQFCEDNNNERSRINKFFDRNFYLDILEKTYHGKHYTIQKVGKDLKTGHNLYAVELDVDDFDLGDFSIDRLKV